MKKFICLLIGLVFTFGLMVNANAREVGDFAGLSDCLTNETDTVCKITGTEKIELTNYLWITGEKVLNLNGATITSPDWAFLINNSKLRIEGKGVIDSGLNSVDASAIILYGSEDSTATTYSALYVESDVTIKGPSAAIAIFAAGDKYKAYGVDLTVAGTLISDNTAITTNGYIRNVDNRNGINVVIKDGATIKTTKEGGSAIYGAGYANWTIGKATISGNGSGIGIKSGKWVIDGAKVTATDVGEIPTKGFSNGINASGAAIQIESNDAYAGEIDLTINSGKFESTHSYAFYEYLDLRTKDDKGNTLTPTKETKVAKLAFNGGEFAAKEGLGTSILVSEQLNSKINDSAKIGRFITGGTFTGTIPAKYVAVNYEANESGGKTTVRLKRADYTAVDAALKEAEKVDKTKYTAETYAKLTKAIEAVVKDLDYTKQTDVDKMASDITTAIKGLVELPATSVPKVDVTETVEKITVGVTDQKVTEELLIEELANSNIKTDGKKVSIVIDAKVTTKEDVSENILGAITNTTKEKLKNAVIGGYFDINIIVYEKDTNNSLGALTDLKKSVKLSVVLPKELKTAAEGYSRKYYIIRNHGDKTDIITPTLSKDGNSLEFESNKFSTFAIAYEDAKVEIPKTYDGIFNYVGIALISLLGSGLSVKALVKRKLKRN